MRRPLWAAVVLSGLFAPSHIRADSLVLNPGQKLEIRFTGPSPSCSGGPCDTLSVDYGDFTTAVPLAEMLCDSWIFDGADQLGMEACVGFSTFFVSPQAGFPNPSIRIDFTSINNGTIQGLIEAHANQQVIFSDPLTIRVLLGTDHGSGGGPLQVLSVTETPEPGSVILFQLGAVLVWISRRYLSAAS